MQLDAKVRRHDRLVSQTVNDDFSFWGIVKGWHERKPMSVFTGVWVRKNWCNGFRFQNPTSSNDHIGVRWERVMGHDLYFNRLIDWAPVQRGNASMRNAFGVEASKHTSPLKSLHLSRFCQPLCSVSYRTFPNLFLGFHTWPEMKSPGYTPFEHWKGIHRLELTFNEKLDSFLATSNVRKQLPFSSRSWVVSEVVLSSTSA